MKKSSERALIECKRRGWPAGTVERRLPHTFRTVDLFGLFDVVALHDGPGVLGIQACTTDVAPHLRKMEETLLLARWLSAGNKAEVWAFRRVKLKRGSVAVRWRLRRIWAELGPGTTLVAWHEEGA